MPDGDVIVKGDPSVTHVPGSTELEKRVEKLEPPKPAS